MFVANHCSWDDIPFLGATIGWRNYKIVAKKELEKVPILGTAIRVAGNIEVDRSDRRSQLATLKKGIQYLKVRCLLTCLCTVNEHRSTEGSNVILLDLGRCSPVYIRGRNQIAKWSFDEI